MQIKVCFNEELRLQLLDNSELLTRIAARAGTNFLRCRAWLNRDAENLTNYAFILSVSEEMNLALEDIVDVYREENTNRL